MRLVKMSVSCLIGRLGTRTGQWDLYIMDDFLEALGLTIDQWELVKVNDLIGRDAKRPDQWEICTRSHWKRCQEAWPMRHVRAFSLDEMARQRPDHTLPHIVHAEDDQLSTFSAWSLHAMLKQFKARGHTPANLIHFNVGGRGGEGRQGYTGTVTDPLH